MQEYVNGLVLLNGKLVQKNFAIKNKKIYFNYEPTDNPIDLTGKVVAPGFVDLHVHTRVPGYEYKEDIKHIEKAALAGGFTTIVAMANINPKPEDEESMKAVLEVVKSNKINIIQSARVTKNKRVADLKSLSKYTHIFTDDGEPIADENVMKEALMQAKENNALLLLHEEDHSLKGVAYESAFTKENNLPAFTSEYEWKIVERDINLNKDINAKIHLQHISTKETLKFLKKAQKKKMNVSAEVTPHHLFFSNEDIKEDNANFKMNPPLGSLEDQQALIKAFKKGLLNIIATDHAPHSQEEKSQGFAKSLNGIIGLETAFSACLSILGDKQLAKILKALTINPAKLIGLDVEIKEGQNANIVIIDPNEKWIFQEKDIQSKSKNSPWINKELKGKIIDVIFTKE